MIFIHATCNKLSKLFSQRIKELQKHNSVFGHVKKHETCLVLCKHFNEELYKADKYKVQILEKFLSIDKLTRNDRNAINTQYGSIRETP